MIAFYKPNTTGAISLVCILLIQACTVGPNYPRPTATIPQAYKEVGNWKVAEAKDQKPRGNWWEVFADPQLNALEQKVNVSNQNLKAAAARYQEARALFRY